LADLLPALKGEAFRRKSKGYSHYLRSREDFDNELRAWYVAVTRALEKLYILDGPYPFLESV